MMTKIQAESKWPFLDSDSEKNVIDLTKPFS